MAKKQKADILAEIYEGANLFSKMEIFDPKFSGSDYDPKLDQNRLENGITRIFNLMKNGMWVTLEVISKNTKIGESSVSAQLRNLRKDHFGGHTIEKRRKGEKTNGVWEYKLTVNQSSNGFTP